MVDHHHLEPFYPLRSFFQYVLWRYRHKCCSRKTQLSGEFFVSGPHITSPWTLGRKAWEHTKGQRKPNQVPRTTAMGLNSNCTLLTQMSLAQATFPAIPIGQDGVFPGNLSRKQFLTVRWTCEPSLSPSQSKQWRQQTAHTGTHTQLPLGNHWLVHRNSTMDRSHLWPSNVKKISYKVYFGFYYEKINEGKIDRSVSQVLATQAWRLHLDP